MKRNYSNRFKTDGRFVLDSLWKDSDPHTPTIEELKKAEQTKTK
ncbi:MAG: hypothetical protein WC208_16520 [Gallionella sp.]|jgi:hypothetical protein